MAIPFPNSSTVRYLYFLFCGSWKLKVIFNLGVVDGNLAFTSNQERSSCCIQIWYNLGTVIFGMYTSYNSCLRGPRRPKLRRATSNINSNQYQVVLDHFGLFLENFHFCSLRLFWAPGVIWRSYFRPRADFSSIFIMWKRFYTSKYVYTCPKLLSPNCPNLYTKIWIHWATFVYIL